MRPQLPLTHNFAFLQHTPSKSLRVEIIDTHHQPTLCSPIVIHVTETPCYVSLAYILYTLHVWPHSPCWPLLLRVARLTSLPLTYVRTCARNAVLGITGLHLVRVACLASFLTDLHFVRVAHLLSFSLLAYISYALLLWPHSPR